MEKMDKRASFKTILFNITIFLSLIISHATKFICKGHYNICTFVNYVPFMFK